MSRQILDDYPKDKTTIVTSKLLLDRVAVHIKRSGCSNQTDFITRALVNQLEKEGDLEIRKMLEEEREE